MDQGLKADWNHASYDRQKRASYSKLVIQYPKKWLLLDSFTLCLSSLRKKCFKDLVLPSRVQAWCCLKGIRAVEFRKSVLKNIFPWKCIILNFSPILEVIYSKDKNKALDDGIGIFFSVPNLVLYNRDSSAWNCSKVKCSVKVRCWHFFHSKIWNCSKIQNLSRYWAVHILLLTNNFPPSVDGDWRGSWGLLQQHVAAGPFLSPPVTCHWLQVPGVWQGSTQGDERGCDGPCTKSELSLR